MIHRQNRPVNLLTDQETFVLATRKKFYRFEKTVKEKCFDDS